MEDPCGHKTPPGSSREAGELWFIYCLFSRGVRAYFTRAEQTGRDAEKLTAWNFLLLFCKFNRARGRNRDSPQAQNLRGPKNLVIKINNILI